MQIYSVFLGRNLKCGVLKTFLKVDSKFCVSFNLTLNRAKSQLCRMSYRICQSTSTSVISHGVFDLIFRWLFTGELEKLQDFAKKHIRQGCQSLGRLAYASVCKTQFCEYDLEISRSIRLYCLSTTKSVVFPCKTLDF